MHWQDILFVLRLCEALYWVEETEQIEFCNHEAKNLIEPDVKRLSRREGNVYSLFVSNFISLTLFLLIHTEFA